MMPKAEDTWDSPTGSVMILGLVSVSSGHRKSFHFHTKVKMNTAEMAGLLSGM